LVGARQRPEVLVDRGDARVEQLVTACASAIERRQTSGTPRRSSSSIASRSRSRRSESRRHHCVK
jgi:hypothetical protein